MFLMISGMNYRLKYGCVAVLSNGFLVLMLHTRIADLEIIRPMFQERVLIKLT